MSEAEVLPWPRSLFKVTPQQTKIFFVCFANAGLEKVPLDRARFGLPSAELARKVDVRELERKNARTWFENWWAGPFGVYAAQDLTSDLQRLTGSSVCITLGLELDDYPDLSPIQTLWALCRWFCARGAAVVLDVHAFRFRTREQVGALAFDAADVTRDVKLVLESQPSRNGLHLMHTRGLCKFARPELMAFTTPDDAPRLGSVMNQLGRALMEGAPAEQLRLRIADDVELLTAPAEDAPLIEALGLEAAVCLVRSDGAPLSDWGSA